jgi:hypothetical protein
MGTVKQRKLWRKPKGLFKRDHAPRGSDATALRASRHALLSEVEESEAEQAIAEAEDALEEKPADASIESAVLAPLGYTSKGPITANSDYAGKSDLERTAQLMRDLDLEPGRSHGIRVIRASPSPFKRRR